MSYRTLSAIPLVAALLLAGCVNVPAEDVEAASVGAASATAEAQPAPIPVAFDGALGAGAFACAVVVCQGQNVQPSERLFETDAWGANAVELTMTWDAASPANERLVLGVFTCDKSECRSDADLSQLEYVYGASPLTFSLDEIVVPAGETLYVFMNVGPAVASDVVFAQATTPQEFHIEGTIG